jgi:hypothetical protein
MLMVVQGDGQWWQRLKAIAPGLALLIFLLVPLYAISIAFSIRTGIFNLSDHTIGAEEVKALWAFIASGLATAATIIGLLFRRSHDNRTLLAQKEADNRTALLQQDTSARLALDTVVKSLELLVLNDGTYAPKARVAGALAALVHLEHPVIAMRTLSAAWDDSAVDGATACWLISEVLEKGTDESKYEAAVLLLAHASKLCADDSHKGFYEWPAIIDLKWPMSIPRLARYVILLSLVELVLSRDQDWWSHDPALMTLLLHESLQTDEDSGIRNMAAYFLTALLPLFDHRDGAYKWAFQSGYLTLAEIRDGVAQHEISSGIPDDARMRQKDLRAWAGGSKTRPSSGMPWGVSPPVPHPDIATRVLPSWVRSVFGRTC